MDIEFNNLKSLYDFYSQDYKLEWDYAHLGFYLYFEDKKSREYKLYVSEELVSLLKRSRILKWYWDEVTHIHFDNDDDTLSDVWEYGVKKFMEKYDDPSRGLKEWI